MTVILADKKTLDKSFHNQMKKILWALAFPMLLMGCKKSEPEQPITPTLSINGKWKYNANYGFPVGCNDMFGSLWEVKEGKASLLYMPPNVGYYWVTGEVLLYDITQTTTPNSYTALGNAHGKIGVEHQNVPADITVSADAQSLTLVMGGVCNPQQVWTRTK